jgi:hypothetical protein
VVKASDAKTVFAHVLHEMEHMRGSFEASKEAGVTCIVLLSSLNVEDPLSSEVNTKERITTLHANADVNLPEITLGCIAARPG